MRLLLSLVLGFAAQMAVAQTGFGPLVTGSCYLAERSVVLFSEDDALTADVLELAQAFDRQRARIRPVRRLHQVAHGDLCRQGAFDATGLNTSEMSDALFGWPVIIVVSNSDAAPVQVLAHVPELAIWAGHPFVKLGELDWQHATDMTGEGDTNAALAPIMAAAEDMALALQFFSDGDMEAAVNRRPAPDNVTPLARAWLSGIPIALPSKTFFLKSASDVFDLPPSRGGRRPLDLFRDVASGAISPASALQISIPAFDVICDWGATENVTEIRWASFVSGFWQVMRNGDHLIDPNAPLNAVGTALSKSRTCFANPVAGLVERSDRNLTTVTLSERLAGVVRSTMAHSPQNAAIRAQLATEMVTVFAGLSTLPFEAENRDTSLPMVDAISTTWLGQCTGPQQDPPTPVRALSTAAIPPAGSPLSLLLGLIHFAHMGTSDKFDFGTLTQASRWARGSPKIGRTLRKAIAANDADLAETIDDWFNNEAEDDLKAAVHFLIFAEDDEYAENQAELAATYFGFDGESALARELLRQTIYTSALSFYRQQGSSFLDAQYQRAYQRMTDLAPWLTSTDDLDNLFRFSHENAIKVAEIDILNLIYSFDFETLINFDTKFEDIAFNWDRLVLPPKNRDPWPLFAPDVSALPEIPIPSIDGSANLAARSVAISAAVHEVLAIYQRAAEATVFTSDRSSAVLSVMVDAAYRSVSSRYATDETYIPNANTEHMHDAMRQAFEDLAREGRNLQSLTAGHEEPTLQELLELALFVWNGGIGVYLVGEWSAESNGEAIAERAADIELAAHLLLAFLAPQEVEAEPLAAQLDKRLRNDVHWHPALQRIAARLAIDLLDPDAIDRAQNRAAIFAELDTLISVDARQKMLDAGFIQAAAFGLPLRLLFATKDAGGNTPPTFAQIENALRQELSRFSFREALRSGPLRDIGGAFAALSAGLEDMQASLDLGNSIVAGLATEKYADLRTYGASIFPSLDPSLEALTLSQFLLLSATETQTDTLNIESLLENCPQLSTTLLAWKLHLDAFHDNVSDVEAAQEILSRILEDGDQYRTIYYFADFDLSLFSLKFGLVPGIPLFASDAPSGGLSFSFGSFGKLDTPWRLDMRMGVAATEYSGSPAFAAALHLAEQIANNPGGDAAEMLAPVLVTLETIAFGGSLVDDPDITLVPHRSEKSLPSVLGGPMPPTYALIHRIGRLPRAEERLFALAQKSEELGLTALARRIAGLAIAFTIEKFDQARDAERAATTSPDEDTFPVSGQDRLKALMTGERSFGGLVAARAVGVGLYDLPKNLVQDLLCSKRDDGCPDMPLFATQLEQAQIADDQNLPICERIVRAVLRGGNIPFRKEEMADCMHGLLGMDVAATQFAPELFARFAQAGFVDVGWISNADQLTRQSIQIASQISISERAEHFANTARIAFLLRKPELAARFAILRTLADISDPAHSNLPEIRKTELQDFLGVVRPFARSNDVAFLESVLNRESLITPSDRAQAEQILANILGQNR